MNALGIIAMAVVEAFFSGMETGVYRLNRIRLRHRAEQGRPDAVRISRLIRNPQALVCTTLAGTNLSVYVSTAICTAMMVGLVGDDYAELAATLVLAPLLLVFAEALPKSMFQAHANVLVYKLSWLLQVGAWVLLPISTLLRGVTWVSTQIFGQAPARPWSLSEERLRYFLTEGAREGVLSPQQDAMARNIMALATVKVQQVMIPEEGVKMVPIDASLEDLRRAAAEHPHTRLPVYEADRHRVIGAVNLIDFVCAEGEPSVAELVRPLPRVSAERTIDEALVQLQKRRQVMSVVADSEGRAIGIVTMKDLVEEVAGELYEW